jgi:IS5 family transposase
LQFHLEDFPQISSRNSVVAAEGPVWPKKPETGEGDLFRAKHDQIINLKHELV